MILQGAQSCTAEAKGLQILTRSDANLALRAFCNPEQINARPTRRFSAPF